MPAVRAKFTTIELAPTVCTERCGGVRLITHVSLLIAGPPGRYTRALTARILCRILNDRHSTRVASKLDSEQRYDTFPAIVTANMRVQAAPLCEIPLPDRHRKFLLTALPDSPTGPRDTHGQVGCTRWNGGPGLIPPRPQAGRTARPNTVARR